MKINIFDYTDYRVFLKEYYEDRKKRDARFSYRFFSMQCGYSSPNFFKLVSDGKRNLSPTSISTFSNFFDFTDNEKVYFEYLVNFNQAKTSENKKKWARKILQLSLFKRIHPLGQDQFEYYAHWYYVAIRELFSIRDISFTPMLISQLLQPPVPIVKVKAAIKTLERLKLIKKVNNQYIQTSTMISTGNEISSCAIALHHQEMMSLAYNSIATINRSKRDISGVTIPISESNIEELKSLIQSFRKSILQLSEADKYPEQIYQVSIQMFPLTLPNRNEDNS